MFQPLLPMQMPHMSEIRQVSPTPAGVLETARAEVDTFQQQNPEVDACVVSIETPRKVSTAYVAKHLDAQVLKGFKAIANLTRMREREFTQQRPHQELSLIGVRNKLDEAFIEYFKRIVGIPLDLSDRITIHD